eukprot:4892-Heterococcus_DN1.PRE.1
MQHKLYVQHAGAHPWVGDSFVSILPCWHISERTAEYFTLSRGAKMVYSNVRNFKTDVVKYKPYYLIAVPRLSKTIYKGAQTKFAAQPASQQKFVAIFSAVSTLYMRLARVGAGMVVRSKSPSLAEKALATLGMIFLYPIVKFAYIKHAPNLVDKLVWSKVRDGKGGRVKVIVSGGSSLAEHLEDFFEMVGQ